MQKRSWFFDFFDCVSDFCMVFLEEEAEICEIIRKIARIIKQVLFILRFKEKKNKFIEVFLKKS